MTVAVLGLWHLGSVTAACLARHHRVVGVDFDSETVARLSAGRAPLREPGLDDLVALGLARGTLEFSTNPAVIADADALWVCYDAPVDSQDRSNTAWVVERIERALPYMRSGTPVLLSSQLPVGTCASLAAAHPGIDFACSPENLRLGRAIDAFARPGRIVVGSSVAARPTLAKLLAPIGVPIVWMRPASAEMLKHALNGFLALSIAFINEVATLGEAVGADAREVALGLKGDPRVGPHAYLNPGGPFAGGTLARDVVVLSELGAAQRLPAAVIPAIKESNDRHRGWALRKLASALADVPRPTVAVLGLAYTPGTSTLRRSAAVELCRALAASGAIVRAFDPLIGAVDDEHRDIVLAGSAVEALRGAHAVAICTAWPALLELDWLGLLVAMARPVVVDAHRHVESLVADYPGVIYLSVGRP